MKTVAFIDLHLEGHRLAYMRYHVKIVAESGHHVICITPDAGKIRNWINENYPDLSENIKYYPFLMYELHVPHKPGQFNGLLFQIRLWRKYDKIIDNACIELNVKIDLVFFNYLDSLLGNYLHPLLIDLFFKYKWTGIYFHPKLLRLHPELLQKRASLSDIDIVLTSKNCIAIAFHDEGIINGQSYRLNNKKVLLFPEIADDTLPNHDHKIYKEIREKAKGRITTGIVGVEPFKSSGELMRLAKKMDPSLYFFAFTGPFEEFFLDYFFSETTAYEFKEFISHPPENVYINLGPLKEGMEYNSVLSAFDIVYIIYKDFPSASNRLTKASQLKRLVIADEKYCVGEDVQNYNLGITVNGDDVDSIEKGIITLRERIIRNDFPLKEWEIYSARNSIDVLKQKFKELIGMI